MRRACGDDGWAPLETASPSCRWCGAGHPANPRAVIVGLNPSPISVAAGHYFQGRVGQRELRRLASARLFDLPEGVRTFEDAALASRIGFTDIVKRPTVGEKDLVAGELEHGRGILREKLEALGVPLVVCVFRTPGPFDAVAKADLVMAELTGLLEFWARPAPGWSL